MAKMFEDLGLSGDPSSRSASASEAMAAASRVEATKREESLASGFCRRLVEEVIEFESTLDQTKEVGLRLVSFGKSIKFIVRDISWYDPSLIMFHGEHKGQQIKLVQHISQISFLLLAIKRPDQSLPKVPFGFQPAAVREFTEKATAAGMTLANDIWTATDGKQFKIDGTPIDKA